MKIIQKKLKNIKNFFKKWLTVVKFYYIIKVRIIKGVFYFERKAFQTSVRCKKQNENTSKA